MMKYAKREKTLKNYIFILETLKNNNNQEGLKEILLEPCGDLLYKASLIKYYGFDEEIKGYDNPYLN